MCIYDIRLEHVITRALGDLLLLLVRLHDQSSSSDEVGGLLQVLQDPIQFLVKRSC